MHTEPCWVHYIQDPNLTVLLGNRQQLLQLVVRDLYAVHDKRKSIFDSRMLRSNICESLWYLSVGQLNNGKWPTCFARTVCLRIGRFRTPNRAGTRVRSFALALGSRKRDFQQSKGSLQRRLDKQLASCHVSSRPIRSLHFLIVFSNKFDQENLHSTRNK